ncbi:heme ABC transporter ATP-binding protein CcmA [Chimaeribacter coloradensis]|uniref:Heme ABC transporter ATP-binding protein CcmA n=1 Tax=Chimaeribacter coloradensis TaxID=2060068 RepID=A0A2N5E232_9GAMM|nr:cytochrome c biogenesis heme-transporting ATPase CcmA [Chimaeribacter coloradensis]PLR34490.1 heme ABC transporter ATP-binding protein CcmA [Chimaeribacter coloradensis]
MLEALRLSCVRDERVLFSDLNFNITPGEIVQVEGQNGAGKTSLLRILAGLAQPESGQVRWQGEAIGRARDAFHRQLLFLGHQAGVKALLTPFENLAFYQSVMGKPDYDAIWQALAQVGLLGYEEVPVGQLSAGQQRRVALARLWLSRALLWVLDEPLTAIDQQGVELLMAQFEQQAARGGMVLLTTHQPLPAAGRAVRRLRLTQGEAA